MEAAHPQIDFTSLLQFHDSVLQFQNLVKEKEMTDAQDHWPFHPERLKRFIDAKQSEMELFCKIVSLDSVVFIPENDELKKQLAKSQFALVLYIPPLEEWSEIISSAMASYVRNPFPKSTEHDEVAWHTIEAKRNLLLSKLDEFENHARINKDVENVQFLITYKVHLKSFGCTYTTYENGQVFKNQLLQLPSPPTDLRVKILEVDSSIRMFRVDWNSSTLYHVDKFIVQCRNKNGSEKWRRDTETPFIHLKYETDLEIRVAVDTAFGQSEFSQVLSLTEALTEQPGASGSIKLEPVEVQPEENIRIAEKFAENWVKTGEKNGKDLIAVPLTKSSTSAVQRFVFDDGGGNADNKTILMMGASGAEKSLLINSMANFIFGVEQEDRFRFQLMEDDQTEQPTVYDIHHVEGSRVPFSLTIVDIPNCDDGVDVEHLPEMVRKFLNDENGIRKLDVVGIVSQPDSPPELTPPQAYVLNTILSIFGKDLKEDVCFFLSPSTVEKVPPVLKAVVAAGLPFPGGQPVHYKFNHDDSAGLWRMGMESFQNFFANLETKRGKSLETTKEVLEDRRILKNMVEELGILISNGKKNSELREKTRQVIADSKSQIEAIQEDEAGSSDFKISQEEDLVNGERVVNCAACDITCWFEWEVNEEPNCPKCSCVKEAHFVSTKYKWMTSVTRAISSDNHDKYGDELVKMQLAEENLKRLEEDGEEFRRELLQGERLISERIRQLEEIALHPFFMQPESIELIIKSEQLGRRQKFEERVYSLQKSLEICKIIKKIKNKSLSTFAT